MKSISDQITTQGMYATGDAAEAVRAIAQMRRTLNSVQSALENGEFNGALNLARQIAKTADVLTLHVAATEHHVATVITLAECKAAMDWRRELAIVKAGVANGVRRTLRESKPDAG